MVVTQVLGAEDGSSVTSTNQDEVQMPGGHHDPTRLKSLGPLTRVEPSDQPGGLFTASTPKSRRHNQRSVTNMKQQHLLVPLGCPFIDDMPNSSKFLTLVSIKPHFFVTNDSKEITEFLIMLADPSGSVKMKL